MKNKFYTILFSLVMFCALCGTMTTTQGCASFQGSRYCTTCDDFLLSWQDDPLPFYEGTILDITGGMFLETACFEFNVETFSDLFKIGDKIKVYPVWNNGEFCKKYRVELPNDVTTDSGIKAIILDEQDVIKKE